MAQHRRHGPPDSRSRTWTFFAVAFVWSWAWWLLAAITGIAISEPVGLLFYFFGVLGPLMAAFWVAGRTGAVYRRALLRRIWDPRGIAGRWWCALIAVSVTPAVAGAIGHRLQGHETFVANLSIGAAVALAAPALIAGLAEEPGWRGVVLDAWQQRARPLHVAGGIGVLWSMWHLPLHLVQGSYYNELGITATRTWLTHAMLILIGILLVWLVNGSGGRVLLAVVAHAGFNTAINVVPASTARDVAALIGLTITVTLVVWLTRGQLGYVPEHASSSD